MFFFCHWGICILVLFSNISKRLEDFKETTEEQLESRLEMYKKAIKNHAYRQAMEDLEENYVPYEEFQAEQEKVEVSA